MNNKIALISDIHIGARNDSKVFYDYMNRFLHGIFIPSIQENKVDDVFVLGDLLDRRKFINFGTLQYLNSFIESLTKECGVNLHILLGNHDVFYKDTNELNALKELRLDKNFKNVYVYDKITRFNENILIVPWLNVENIEEFLTIDKYKIVFGHFDIAGFDLGGCLSKGMSYTDFSKFEKVFTGHYHRKQCKYNIQYLGSPIQFTWSDYDNEKGFFLLDTNTYESTFVKNEESLFYVFEYHDENITTIDEIYKQIDSSKIKDKYVKIEVISKKNEYWFDCILNRIQEYEPIHIKILDTINFMYSYDDNFEEDLIEKNKDTSSSTYDHILKFIDTNIDETSRNEIKTIVKSLYDASNEMEVSIDS